MRTPMVMRSLLGIGGIALVAAGGGCSTSPLEDLPAPAQTPAAIPELVLPSPPEKALPHLPIALSERETAAIENLRRRGASIAVFTGSGAVLVHFPLGNLERQWRKRGLPTAQCGMAIEYSFSPDDTGPPMTDADLVYLDGIPRL